MASYILSKYGISIKDKKIMDVGCYLGIQCFGAIELGANHAVGIDIPEYYVNQSTKDVNASKILEERRDQIRNEHPHIDRSKISFFDTSVASDISAMICAFVILSLTAVSLFVAMSAP